MTWFDIECINDNHYIIRSDKIIYYSYNEDDKYTTIQTEQGWINCKGNITKELRKQFLLTSKASVIVVKGE